MIDAPRSGPARRDLPAWLPARFLSERFWIGTLAVIVAFLGLLYVRFLLLAKVDHDEVEHAHVAFRILTGELPYRDFYQNHWPAWWLVISSFVQAFPFSVKAILAARGVSLLALAGCWWLGLRMLEQIPGGRTKLSFLAYTAGVIVLAYEFQFYVARPDPLMALFGTAGLCLVPARGALRSGRALGLGILFGLALSLSAKVLPLALVIPLLVTWQALRAQTLQPLLAGLAYAAGFALAMLPTAWWLWQHGLFEAFYFDVFALNLAVSKPWHWSFGLLGAALFMPSLLGVLAWAWTRNWASAGNDNVFMVVFLALFCGLLLAFVARHPGLYNLQLLTVPLAVGVASLASFLWLRTGNLGNRLLIIALLLAHPVSYTANLLLMLRAKGGIMPNELQQIMDLARPGGRTCVAFSPVHPVFCNSVSQLSNGWDLTFPKTITEPRQLERFHRLWNEGIERALSIPPDIILRRSPVEDWEKAVETGLIRQDQLDALDDLEPAYDLRIIGNYEFWVRRPTP